MKAVALICLCAQIVTGCATSPMARGMIPYLDYSRFSPTDRTLTVEEIKGVMQAKSWEPPAIEQESLQNALEETLKRSGLFRAVGNIQETDYALQTELVSQKLLPGVQADFLLAVHYRLLDTASGQVVWKETVLTQYDSFGGNIQDLHEGAVRKNLTQLLEKLSMVLQRRL